MKRRRAPMERPAALARQVLSSRGITQPEQIDLLAVLDDFRIVLRREPMANAEGRLVRSGRHAVMTIDESAFWSEKWLFVGAHEFGHMVQHEHRLELACFPKKGATSHERSRSWLDEEAASGFGVEFLTPAPMVLPRYVRRDSPAARARVLHETFGVSLPVAALRVLDFTDEPCAVAYAERGRVAWCTATKAFGVKVKDRMPLPEESGARAATDVESVVRASAWGEPGDVREVRAHTLPIPGFDAAVTMLWHDGA